MKKNLARLALRLLRSAFAASPDQFHRLLGRAVLLQRGLLSEKEFLSEFTDYFANLNRVELMSAIDFPEKAARLRRPGGYKSPILDYRGNHTRSPGGPLQRFLWKRRFSLLAHWGIRLDVLILRAGEQVPPHAHSRVVSGFYVLEGAVAVRHYDRVGHLDNALLVRPTIDRVEGPGDFTTNSERHDNIHWLSGAADESFLFRLTILGTPTLPWDKARGASDRIYLDPSSQPRADGLIRARYVSEDVAQRLSFHETCVPAS